MLAYLGEDASLRLKSFLGYAPQLFVAIILFSHPELPPVRGMAAV